MSPLRIYYQPHGGISAIPDIAGLFDLKVFGCEAVSDYSQQRVFFYSPDAVATFNHEVSQFRPDCIIIETLSEEMLIALTKTRRFYFGPIVLFWGDLINQNTLFLLRRLAQLVDLALVVDMASARKLKSENLPVEYVIFPAPRHLYTPLAGSQKEFDAVFAGNMPMKSQWYSRNSAIQTRLELVKAFASRPNFGLFGGPHWRNFGLDVSGWVDEYELVKVYNRSKIVLACDQFLTAEGFTSNRTTKALMSGAFLLIKSFKGIERLFKNHEHLVWFDSVSEATELADHYLQHEEGRVRIGEAGMRWAQENADLRTCFENWSQTAPVRKQYGSSWHRMSAVQVWRVSYFLRRFLIRAGGELGILSPEWFRSI